MSTPADASSAQLTPEFCPYVGLAPFEAAHSDYYFGRDLDAANLCDNVLVAPVTVLYGASGVGKTSILNVGLPKALDHSGIDCKLVIGREWQDPAKLQDWLHVVTESAADAPLLIVVLDQFEEYFLYRKAREGGAFETALAALLERSDMEVHLLFSVRDDGLHQLDALRQRLPTLLDNTIQLQHLDEVAVREAIEGPISVYNQNQPRSSAPVRIGKGFVDALITDLRHAQSASAQRAAAVSDATTVELPFLQLTLECLWATMPPKAHRWLSVKRLKDLGGVDRIVTTHVADTMEALSEGERVLATQIFHYLVTPSGGKFAYLPEDLSYLLGETTGRAIDPTKISKLLRTLADSEARVLRRAGERFELFHDILARPILDWRAQYPENPPFAYLEDLFTGDKHALFGAGQIFGRLRSVSPSPLKERMVSRNHLLVLSTGQVLDLRSRFGTTVNANTLRFGDTDRRLRSGDVIGLANSAALRFWTVEDLDNQPDDAPATPTDVADSWAILIDGQTRGVIAIKRQLQYLVIDRHDAITATPEEHAASFAVLLRHERGLGYITSLTEEPPLEVVERRDAFRDREWPLQRGQEFLTLLRDFPNPQGLSDLEGAERGLFKFGDRRFEIIPNLLFPM